MGKQARSRAARAAKVPAKTREQRQAEKQTLAMWALLGNGGAGIGSALKPEVERAEREALRQAGLITFDKRVRPFKLEVTDRGWRWAEEHLADALPDKTYGGAFVLRAWLTRLRAFMQARDIGLAEILAEQAERRFPSVESQRAAQPTDVSPFHDYSGLRERIRRAYLEVTGGSFNRRALLRDIRERLPNVDRSDLDDALNRMQRDEDASLMRLDNSVEITDADRAAALYIGREPRHILWISR
jgi:hypothetical protein